MASKPAAELVQPEWAILVVGDWVVDEYWYLVGHSSSLSSHVGKEHFRAWHNRGDLIRDLCGAGHVARVLQKLREEASIDPYMLVGLGNWDGADQDLISDLLNPSSEVRRAKFRLRFGEVKRNQKVQLFALDTSRGTTRVIRLYRPTEGDWVQMSRIDWELQKFDGVSPRTARLPEDLPRAKHIVIIVYDLQKGAISDTLVKSLDQRFPDANWYIRSKERFPSWRSSLRKGKLKLLVIGPEVAIQGSPLDYWMVDRRITYRSLEILQPTTRADSVILLSSERAVVARLAKENKCVTGEAPVEPDPVARVGWWSAFFASLVHESYKEESLRQEHIETSLANAEWICREWAEARAQSDRPGTQDRSRAINCDYSSWKDEEETWRQARMDQGIIEGQDGCRLDVWRGANDVPGYIACIEEKCEEVRRIAKSLRAFRDNSGHNPRSLSMLLRGDPGAGKTSLAQALARALNFFFLQCDLTQFGSRDDLLDFFDSIATEQSRQDKDVLAFVDEVNTRLEGTEVYSAFMTPLETGTYVRRGRIFTLRPCVWMFAGTGMTRLPKEKDKGAPAPKLPDFLARLTMEVDLDFQSLQRKAGKAKESEARFKHEARLEQVYLGAMMIGKYHPGVTHVSEAVLWQFYHLEPHPRDAAKAPARLVRKWVTLLSDIQGGRVTLRNTLHWCKEGGIDNPPEGLDRPVELAFSKAEQGAVRKLAPRLIRRGRAS